MPTLAQPPLFAMGAAEFATVGFALVALIVLVDVFDISLPRGDALGVGGALVAVSMVLLGTPLAVCVGVACTIIAEFLRRTHPKGRLLAAAMTRAVSASMGWAAYAAARAVEVSLLPVAVVALVAFAYLLTEIVVSQVQAARQSNRKFSRLLRGNIRRQTPLLLAQVSAAVLAVLTFSEMRVWSLIPVAALLLLMRQSYALLLDMRETYRMTTEVLVEAAEGQDRRRAGHSDRTATIARRIAMRLGLGASDVERISYAALLHDVDAIGESASANAAGSDCSSGVGRSSEMLNVSHLFCDVAPVLAVCDGISSAASGASESTLLASMVVALASDADCSMRPEVRDAHSEELVRRVAPLVPPSVKARAVAAAIELGYRVPAVS